MERGVAAMHLTFEISIINYDLLELRWPKAFGVVRSRPYLTLANCLLTVDGVDKVEVLRYTAQLTVAAHVESLGVVVQYVQAALLEDAELADVLATDCGVTDYSVSVLPEVVARPPEP